MICRLRRLAVGDAVPYIVSFMIGGHIYAFCI